VHVSVVQRRPSHEALAQQLDGVGSDECESEHTRSGKDDRGRDHDPRRQRDDVRGDGEDAVPACMQERDDRFQRARSLVAVVGARHEVADRPLVDVAERTCRDRSRERGEGGDENDGDVMPGHARAARRG
jgi:hypothetical protein